MEGQPEDSPGIARRLGQLAGWIVASNRRLLVTVIAVLLLVLWVMNRPCRAHHNSAWDHRSMTVDQPQGMEEGKRIERLTSALWMALGDIEVLELRLGWATREYEAVQNGDQEMLAVTISGKQVDTDMLVNRLGRIRKLLRQLRRTSAWAGDLARKGNALIAAVESSDLKDLRDILEHYDAYVIGEGRPGLVVDDRIPGMMMVWDGDGSVMNIMLFGRNYDLKPSLSAAEELRDVLR